MAVLRFPPAGGEAFLASVHPGGSVEQVQAATGWDLAVAADVSTTLEPTEAELAQIRRLDPKGFWTGRS
jgi:glutaconate CoA-transferase subunit B